MKLRVVVVLSLLQCFLVVITTTYRASNIQARAFCPPDFTLLQDHCYYFSQEVTMSWDEAWRICQELDYRSVLVNIETAREWTNIKTYLTEENLDTKNWWIGGSDREAEGQWIWYGTNKPFTFSDWCTGNPSNGKGNENCAHLFGKTEKENVDKRFCWNDLHCTHDTYGVSPLHFICEV